MRRDTSVKKAVALVVGALILMVFAANTLAAGAGGDQPTSQGPATGADTSAAAGGNPTTSLATASSAPEGTSLSQAGLDIIKTQGFNVYDGDTFHAFIKGRDEKVRATGVDTPEIDPTEGGAVAARDYTASLVDQNPVWLVFETAYQYDSYGRFLAYVWLHEPPDTIAQARAEIGSATLNGLLVSGGYADLMAVEPNTTFADELAALAGKPAGSAAAALPSVPSSASNTDSGAGSSSTGHGAIKGNISSSGERIYHMPGQRYYDETVINTLRGERWIATEEEAQAAGGRKSKV